MKKSNIMLTIIIFIIIILIILAIISFRIVKDNFYNSESIDGSNKVYKVNNNETKEIYNPDDKADNSLMLVNDSTSFFTVKQYIEKYNNYLAEQNNDALKGIIANDKLSSDMYFDRIVDMYQCEEEQITNYYIHAVNKQQKDVYMVFYQDKLNFTYKIELIEKSEYNNIINGKEEKKAKDNIEKNKYNQYLEVHYDPQKKINAYAEDYIYLLKNDINTAFNLLDADYKKTKFNNNIENFKSYVANNIDNIENNKMTEYGTDYEQNGSDFYYIYYYKNLKNYVFKIKETSIMKYTISLDTYTSNNQNNNIKFTPVNNEINH